MTSHGDSIKSQRPLAGVIMCCTSIPPEQRTELATIAEQMGAAHKFDLTSDVTHLLVGYTDTQKYKYVARERPDVKVVLPEWIEAVRQSWMTGEDFDVAALETKFQAPPFHSLRISITGFDDLAYRQGLSDTIEQNGAQYSGDLTKHVTHLIVAKPEGKKYSYALQWKVKVVSEKWLRDSITRGMALDEAAYDPLKPAEEQGKGAWNVMAAPASRLGKRDREETQAAEPDRRTLRRTASAKLGSQNESIWQDIASHSSADRRKSEGQWDDFETTTKPQSRPITPASVTLPKSKPTLQLQSSEDRNTSAGVFSGRIVYIHGFDRKKTAILESHLQANGATLCRNSIDLEVQPLEKLEEGFAVVPDDVPAHKLPTLPEAGQRLLQVTNWWVEKCLHNKVLVDPTTDTLCRPLPSFPLEGFSGMSIASTGIAGIEKLHISKAVKLLGASYEEYLKATTSLLLCNPSQANKEKLRLASANAIPVVTVDWLLHSIADSEKKAYAEYLTQPLDTTIAQEPKPEAKRKSLGGNLDVSKAQSDAEPSDHRKVPQRKEKQSESAARSPMKSKSKSKSPAPPPKPKPAGPFLADSDDSENDSHTIAADDSVPLPSPRPLRETPSVNSPRHPSSTSASTKSTNPTSPPPMYKAPPSPVKPDLTETIAALLAQNKASRSASAAAAAAAGAVVSPTTSEPPETNRQRRRRGLLGRAPSMQSNPSTVEHESSRAEEGEEQGQDGRQWQGEQGGDGEMMGTQLVYEDPEARKARDMLLRKMGGKVEERREGSVVGMVQDAKIGAVDGGAGGGRSGRRKR